MPRAIDAPYALTAANVAEKLSVDVGRGIRDDEVESRRERYGRNVVVRQRRRPVWKIFIAQFASVIVLLLAIAAAIAFVTRDRAEGVAILVVLLINAVVGFVTEFQAERALDKLRLQVQAGAHVLRDGVHREIDAAQLVVGDVIALTAGSLVPADARLIESIGLKVEEAALTGESVPADKTVAVHDANTPVADRTNMIHLGTTATAGRGVAIVTAVGQDTELGIIGQLMAGVVEEPTPLERALATLGRRLVYVVLAIAAIVILFGWWRGEPFWEMIEVGISLAVAAVPEGLPAITTLIEAVGVLRMARRHAIVRRLPAVETLGGTTVICTDKTGTLTENRLAVRVIDSPDPIRLLHVGALCSEATVSDGAFIGDPTETALLAAAAERNIDIAALRAASPKTGEEPFSAESRRMITTHGDGRSMLKGGPGVVLDLCDRYLDGGGIERPMDDVAKMRFRARNEELASQALRVLAFADSPTGEGFTFLGFTGMIDPPRAGAREAIARARDAGIRVVMLTGDQQQTARAIARELHLDETDVFARVSPADKLRIVAELRESGEVVAVTGDGVNDAPALRRADIGIAMGRSGTDVARQAADLILTDDNLGTIVDAVEQGRTIYANIIRFVHMMFSHNLGEVLLMFVAIAAGMPLPLLPLQILWMNVVTDVFPAFALAMEPSVPERMQRKPRTSSGFLTPSFMLLIAWQGALLGGIALAAYAWAVRMYGEGSHARTVALTAMIGVQLGHMFNCRSRIASAAKGLSRAPLIWGAAAIVAALQIAAISWGPLERILGTTTLTVMDWQITAITLITPIVVVEIQKAVVRATRSPRTAPLP